MRIQARTRRLLSMIYRVNLTICDVVGLRAAFVNSKGYEKIVNRSWSNRTGII